MSEYDIGKDIERLERRVEAIENFITQSIRQEEEKNEKATSTTAKRSAAI